MQAAMPMQAADIPGPTTRDRRTADKKHRRTGAPCRAGPARVEVDGIGGRDEVAHKTFACSY